MEHLREKLDSKTARVGVVGLGYVGLPLAVELCRAGYPVTGIDVDGSKVEALLAGNSYIPDVPDESLKPLIESGQLHPTTDFAVAAELDAVSVCVPTPLRKTKDPDISFVADAVKALSKHLSGPTLVVLESTTYPGTTEELVAPILAGDGDRIIGKDLFVAFSPERVDPGNLTFQTRNTPKVIGGVTPACTEIARSFYAGVVEHIHTVGSAGEAEMVKLLENTFRAVNIALVNEMLLMCDRMGIDIWRVVDAAATKPFGYMPFYPGPGIGGHCIPVDPMYLSWKAKTYDFFNRFIELATDINGNMPRFVINKLLRELNARDQLLKGARVLLVGIGYKEGVVDTRESPGIELLRLLLVHGAVVSFYDPIIEQVTIDGSTYHALELNGETLASHDAVVITTKPPEADVALLAQCDHFVLDTRGALRHVERPNIVRL